MKKILILLLLSLTLKGFSQVWRVVRKPENARYKVYFTNDCGEADIVAYTVLCPSRVKRPGLIYFVSGRSKRGIPIYQVMCKEQADITICWTYRKKYVHWKYTAWERLINEVIK